MFTRRLASFALTSALLLALTPATWANGKGFKDVVNHLQTNYRAKKTKIPLLGLANFAVKVVRPAGVKGFKVAVFEGQDFSPRAGELPFMSVMRQAYLPEKGWKPLVQTNSKRDGALQRAFIFFKENKKDVEVAVTTLSENEAAVIEVKFSPDKMVQFLDNPRLMGISLGGSLRGQTNNTIAGTLSGNLNTARPAAAPRTPSEPTGNSITVVDRTGAPVMGNTVAPTVTVNTNQRLALKAAAEPRANDQNNPPSAATDAAMTDAASAKIAPAVVEPKDPNAIRIETRLVNLNVRALNKTGLPITDLKPEDFQVFEDEAKQEVAHFKPVNAPVNLLVLLDMSGSTQGKHKTMIESVRKFIDLLPANDRMSIVAFTRRYYRLSTFTSDKAVLKTAVEKISKISGGTAYYDAMVEALNDLNHLGDARKAIVVLTDGEDESMFGNEPTGFNFQQMLDRAAEADVTVYPIYFSGADTGRALNLVFSGPSLDRQNDRRTQARKQMQAVADQTGGEVINAQAEGDLAAAYARVATELHTLYSLAYSPDKPKHDGAFRKISVNVSREGALAKTRKGYYDK
ncbi:MAG: VWA domain-containing protein [Acidobacteria bacterium]|nr:VWA domain-containing protein [Acidobacteriota bacterium]MBI3423657.1 VWA domain-containing protein [Acidobacteriota bacterium]